MPWLTADEHQEEVEAARDIVLRRLDRSPAPRAAPFSAKRVRARAAA